MRHRKFGRKLGRNHHHRQALFKNLSRALFTHGQIKTTQAKAKAVRPLVEKICTLALRNNINSRRAIFAYLQDRKLVARLSQVLCQTFTSQKTNFTKITPLKYRQGDNALLVRLSFTKPIDFSSNPSSKQKQPAKKQLKSKPSVLPKKDKHESK